MCFIVWEKFQIICRSALFAQKWFIFKKLDPGWHQICFCLICFFFFYDNTDTISRKKEGTRMKKKRKGKKRFPMWKMKLPIEGMGLFHLLFLLVTRNKWLESYFIIVTCVKMKEFLHNPCCFVWWGGQDFVKSYGKCVLVCALNRSRYCVAVHSSRKKGKKGLRLILNSFGKETSFHGKSTWKHSSRKTVVKSFGSFNLVLTCVQIQHKSISVIPALILLEHWTSVFPALLHSEG